jgi:putative DNA primase/helicase
MSDPHPQQRAEPDRATNGAPTNGAPSTNSTQTLRGDTAMAATVESPSSAPPTGPRRFFADNTFIPRQLARHIAAETPVALGGQALYAWREGAYLESERYLQRRIGALLGDSYRIGRDNDTMATLRRLEARELWEQPEQPLDRIAVANGILDLRTGELSPPTPAFLSPVRIHAAYDPDAPGERVRAFLDSVTGGDDALFRLLMEIVGYLLVPDNRYQKAFMLLGPGGNGKSVFLNVVRALLGPENVSAISLQDLDASRFASAELYGKLANIYADLDARAAYSSSTFKTITGGDSIPAERKHRDAFVFTPYARLVFSANTAPPTADISPAYFDRWVIVPFERNFRGSAAEDENLLAKLTTPRELSGLLTGALDGLARLRERHGFEQTGRARQARETFERDTDPVAAFVADRCIFGEGLSIKRSLVYENFITWARRSGYDAKRLPRNQTVLQRVQELAERHGPALEVRAVNGIRHLRGIEIGEDE